jgi:tetratricopeptide (TPR) repeat protein
MRLSYPITVAMGIWFICSARSQGGVYNLLEPAERAGFAGASPSPLSLPQYRDLLSSLMSLNQPASPIYKRYQQQVTQLEARQRAGNLSPDEQASLGAYLIRLHKFDQAVDVLASALARSPRNFLLLANLASAFQLQGRLDRALSYLQQALDYWPVEWPGFSVEELAWFKAAERYHLRLLKLRYRETLAGPSSRTRPAPTLDDLFGGDKDKVRFVGPSGRYEAGKMDPQEKLKLSPHALAVAQQLSLWFPDDNRLYWLVGEVYNADGQVDAALKIMEDCLWARRFDAPELRQHRLILQEEKPKTGALELEPVPSATSQLETAGSKTASREPNMPGAERTGWLPGKGKLIAVGSGAGTLVLLLAYLQLREARRHRRTQSK